MSRYDLNYLKQRAQAGRTRVIDAYAVSAQNGTGLVQLAEGVVSELAGKDVFVVGSANVGKSTLVKSLSSLLARTLRFRGKSKRLDDKRRDLLMNLNTTQSHLPGTTLQAVRIPCFPSTRHALWDTPGILNQSAMQYSLFPSHLMEPLAHPNKIDIPTRENGKKIRVRKGYSLLIEAGWTNEEVVTTTVDNSNDIEDEDDWFEESSRKKNNNKPFTLARLDVIEDGGNPVEALAFIPSCLTIRVVRTDSNTPTEATIPQSYIDKVQKMVGSSGNFDNNTTSRPLTIYKGGGEGKGTLPEGVVKLTHDDMGKWIRKDIVFASLGWVMLNHSDEFSVKPWCVKDSLWSKRRSLYPSNLENLAEDQIIEKNTVDFDYEDFEYDVNMSDDDPKFERIKERLQYAAERGRKEGDRRGKRKEGYYDDDGDSSW
jgi:energy-coupling factor transporter ATP-binding protein EcfA2